LSEHQCGRNQRHASYTPIQFFQFHRVSPPLNYLLLLQVSLSSGFFQNEKKAKANTHGSRALPMRAEL